MAVIKFPGRRREDEALDQDDIIEEGIDNDVDDDGYADDGRESEREYAEETRRRMADRGNTRPRRKRTAREKVHLALRLIIVLCAAGALIAFLLNSTEHTSYTESEITDVAAVQVPDASGYVNVDGDICIYNRDGASLLNEKGTVVWNITYEMQQPLVDVSGDMIAIGDYGGSTVYLCSTAGPVGQIATNLPIRSLTVSSGGNVACVLADTDATWIYLYDKSGKQIAYIKRSMAKSGYPVSVSLSPNGRLLCCAQLTADNSAIKTSVVFYNFGSVGKNSVDNAVSAYDYDQEIVAYTRFLDNESAVTVSDTRAAFFDGDDVPENIGETKHPAQLQGVWTGGAYVGLLYPDMTGSHEYELDIYSAAGKKTGSVMFDMQYTSIQFDGDRVLISDAQSVLIYTVTGEKRYSGTFPDTVLQVIPTGRANRLLLLTSDKLKMMTLR